eukprot:1085906-Rhodomonas_salina.2
MRYERIAPYKLTTPVSGSECVSSYTVSGTECVSPYKPAMPCPAPASQSPVLTSRIVLPVQRGKRRAKQVSRLCAYAQFSDDLGTDGCILCYSPGRILMPYPDADRGTDISIPCCTPTRICMPLIVLALDFRGLPARVRTYIYMRSLTSAVACVKSTRMCIPVLVLTGGYGATRVQRASTG